MAAEHRGRRRPDRLADAITASASDPDRFAEVFRALGSHVMRFVASRVPSSAAEDVAAATFLRAFRFRHAFDPSRGTPEAWLLSIARGEVMHYWRGQAREGQAMSRFTAETEISHRASCPTAGIDLDALGGADADLVRAHYRDGYSYAELAEREAVPIGTIRSRLARARKVLAGLINNDRSS